MKLKKQPINKCSTKSFLLSLRFFVCIFVAGIALFAYIDKQNELTELRLALPALAKNVRSIQEENTRLKYEIESFESPIHLMELMRKPEFGHLKYPYIKDEIFLEIDKV
ncbi:MAG: hypothetical protein H0X29_08000 [Parachlamydiaceae bacterium]|nr:hypothetical protein [Parachlamydiaceae bacterium]